MEKARGFYTGLLGYEEALRVTTPYGEAVLLKINDDQFIELTTGLKPDQDERLHHIGWETSDIARLHQIVTGLGLGPREFTTTTTGQRHFFLKDPGGHELEFIQFMPGTELARKRGQFLGSKRISTRLLHTGTHVSEEPAAMTFWRGKLGFTETWREAENLYVNLRAPGTRGDYIEFMMTSQPPNRARLGSMHHICLEVASIPDAWRELLARGVPDEPRHQPRVGRNRRRQLNLFDPDGTRVELMEPRTVDR